MTLLNHGTAITFLTSMMVKGALAGGSDTRSQHAGSWNVIVIATIGAVMFLQFLTHQLDLAVRGKRHAREMVQGLYKELTVLGVVAFLLYIVETNVHNLDDVVDVHIFENIHFCLFLAAVVYSLFIGAIVLISKQISKRWDAYEDVDQRRYHDLRQQHRRVALKLGLGEWSPAEDLNTTAAQLKLLLRHPRLWRRWRALSMHVTYHELRRAFVAENTLPDNFSFATYLRKCKQHVELQLVEVSEVAWLAIAWLVAWDLYIHGLMSAEETGSRNLSIVSATISAIVVVAAFVIYAKVQRIYGLLLHSELADLSAFDAAGNRRRGSNSGSDGRWRLRRSGAGLSGGTAANAPAVAARAAERGSLLLNRDQLTANDAVKAVTEVEKRQKELFWMGSPQLLISALQFCLFLLALNVAMLVQFGDELKGSAQKGGAAICIILGILVFFFVLPNVIPAFTMVTHVGERTDKRRLSESLLKQQRAVQRRAVPPSLKEAATWAQVADWERPTWRQRATWLVDHPMTGKLMSLLVAADFFVIAYATYENMNNVDHNAVDAAFYTECGIVGVFAVEALLLVYARGVRAIFCCVDIVETIDILVVMVSIVTLVLTVVLQHHRAAIYGLQAVVMLRLLRLARVFAVLRKADPEAGRAARRGRTAPATAAAGGERDEDEEAADDVGVPLRRSERVGLLQELTRLLHKQGDPMPPKEAMVELTSPSASRSGGGDTAAAAAAADAADADLSAKEQGLPSLPVLASGLNGSGDTGSGNGGAGGGNGSGGGSGEGDGDAAPHPAVLRRVGSRGNSMGRMLGMVGHSSEHAGGSRRQLQRGNFTPGAPGEAAAANGEAALAHATVHGAGRPSISRLASQRSRIATEESHLTPGGGMSALGMVLEHGGGVHDPGREKHVMHLLAHEVWKEVCEAHPDVVALNGRVSVPILRLMLGQPAYDPNVGGQSTVSDMSNHSRTRRRDIDEMREARLAAQLGAGVPVGAPAAEAAAAAAPAGGGGGGGGGGAAARAGQPRPRYTRSRSLLLPAGDLMEVPRFGQQRQDEIGIGAPSPIPEEHSTDSTPRAGALQRVALPPGLALRGQSGLAFQEQQGEVEEGGGGGEAEPPAAAAAAAAAASGEAAAVLDSEQGYLAHPRLLKTGTVSLKETSRGFGDEFRRGTLVLTARQLLFFPDGAALPLADGRLSGTAGAIFTVSLGERFTADLVDAAKPLPAIRLKSAATASAVFVIRGETRDGAKTWLSALQEALDQYV